MQQFEFRFLDNSDMVVTVRYYTARDDLGALEAAEKLCTIHMIEIWQGNRRIARVKKGNVPLGIEDSQSL